MQHPVCDSHHPVIKFLFVIVHMQHPNMLELTQSALLIIDMQEAFRAKIADFNQTAARIPLVTTAAKLLKLPVVVTEQYPNGLGHTATEISEGLHEETV